VDQVPRNYGSPLSLLAVLGPQGVSAPLTVDGPVDASVFRVYVEQVLGPSLTPGDIVGMDNLAVHKVAGITRRDSSAWGAGRISAAVLSRLQPN
jgi:hypothetical protein